VKDADFDRRVALLRRAYDAFNRRDVGGVLPLLAPDVAWPNVPERTTLRGRGAVRAYWLGQFRTADPRVEPTGFLPRADGAVVVGVHQVVRDLTGRRRR
jgi:ketosteroid isomerase-like protein